jgi:hypothetical protein
VSQIFYGPDHDDEKIILNNNLRKLNQTKNEGLFDLFKRAESYEEYRECSEILNFGK